MNNKPAVEDLIKTNSFLYDVDVVDGALVGEIEKKHGIVLQHSGASFYNGHFSYISNINSPFKSYLCSSCCQFINKSGKLDRHLTTFTERLKRLFAKNVYQLREALFAKLGAFHIPYADEQELFRKMAVFGFDSILVDEEKIKDTEKTTWIGKHISVSVLISSNFVEDPVFLSKLTLMTCVTLQ